MKKISVVGMLILVSSIGLTAIFSSNTVFAQGGCGAGGCSSGFEDPNSGFTGGFGGGSSPTETPSGQFPPNQGGGSGFGGLDQPKFGGVPCGGGGGGAQISGSDGQFIGSGGGTSCPESK